MTNLYTAADPGWEKALARLPEELRDIYYTSAYVQACCPPDGEGLLFAYSEDSGATGLYPFIRRRIPEKCFAQGCSPARPCFDLETPYGYGGPVANTNDPAFLSRFESAFLAWCEENGIVAEFLRFHPLLQNEHLFREHLEVLHNRITVTLDLSLSEEDIWMHRISSQNRNTIRKCEKNGLTVSESKDYEAFRSIYEETMHRVGAEDFYLFDSTYYDWMRTDPHCHLLLVHKGTDLLAGAVFMAYGPYFHYHLSGSRTAAMPLAPTNLLLWEAIRFGQRLGCRRMHFGGGLSDSMEDSLFRFKARFSNETLDFYIGKRIHREDVYQELIGEWERCSGQKGRLLLQYREPIT